jgi:bla regulator protein blaR1
MIGELTNHLWQSTIFADLAGLLAVAFRKNRAQVRYWLWLSASLKFLIPFSLLISLGNSLRDALAAGKIVTGVAPPAVSRTMVQVTQPFPDTLMAAPSAPHATSWIPLAILGVWACGFAAIALMRFRDWLRLRAAVRVSTPIDIPTAIAVRSSRGLLEPGIVGFLRPTLILPDGILKNLTPPQLEAVLAHELTHVRRRDNLTAAIHMLVEAVFWFHPFVWWIGARLVEERERACDEAVMSLGSEPRAYADAILSVCRLYVESPLLCASGIGAADLRRRIVRIMAQQIAEGLSTGGKVLLGGAAAAAIGIPLALGMISASKARAQKPQAGDGPLPRFEAASIKVSTIPRPQLGYTAYGNGFVATDTADALIRLAYGYYLSPLKPDQVSGGPDWIKSKVFDIEATVEDSLVKGEWKKLSSDERDKQVMLMLRSLLADRFKLKVTHETKQLPVYVLLLADGGPKFSEDDSQAKNWRIEGHGSGEIEAISADLGWLAGLVSGLLGDRVVLDKTGLQGHYSFTFQRPPLIPAASGDQSAKSASSADFSALSEALENQLGLRLESTTAPVDTIVIEHIEQPTEN